MGAMQKLIRMPLSSLRPLTAVLALALCAAAHAQSEDVLLERLANSTDSAELRSTYESIRVILQDRSGAPSFPDEVVRIVTTTESFRRSNYTGSLLQAAGQAAPLSERSLAYIAQALSALPSFSNYNAMTNILREGLDDLPDSVFELLLEGFNGPHPNLSLQVLSTVSAEDSRYERIVNGIVEYIRTEQGSTGARSFIRNVGTMHEDRAMPARLVDALYDKALSDPRLDIRVEALVAIAAQPLDAGRANILAQTLHRNVTTPDAPENEGLEYFDHSLLQHRPTTAAALLQLLEPPYPSYVIDTWIAMLSSTQHAQAMDVVQGAIDRQGLSEDQFSALIPKLDSDGTFGPHSYGPLDLKFDPLRPDELEEAVRIFAGDGETKKRVRTGYRLYFHYRDDGVPVPLADRALELLADTTEYAVRPVSLALVSRAAEDADRYTSELIELTGAHADNFQAYRRYLKVLGAENAARLVMRYGWDTSLASRFRAEIIHRIDATIIENAGARSELVALLQRIARQEKDNAVVQAAGRTLEALGAEVPVRVALRNADNQRGAMMIAYLAMLAGNTLLFFVGLAAIAWPVPPDAQGKTPGVAGWMVTWLLLSAAMGIALTIGFVGFIGHTSAPPVGWTFGALMPAVIGTVVYVTVAVAAVRRTRRHLHATNQP